LPAWRLVLEENVACARLRDDRTKANETTRMPSEDPHVASWSEMAPRDSTEPINRARDRATRVVRRREDQDAAGRYRRLGRLPVRRSSRCHQALANDQGDHECATAVKMIELAREPRHCGGPCGRAATNSRREGLRRAPGHREADWQQPPKGAQVKAKDDDRHEDRRHGVERAA